MTVLTRAPVLAASPVRLPLPQPRLKGAVSVEQALRTRRSVRAFADAPLTLEEVSQLLWAAQGVTAPGDHRTAPSAGGLHPLTLHLAAGRVSGLRPGVYRYEPASHELVMVSEGDARARITAAARQAWIEQAAAIVVISADLAKPLARYSARAQRFVDIEVGHAAQGLSLQAVALGLGVTDVGAFEETGLKNAIDPTGVEQPLLLLPIGRART
jgi:SagB-type dehydrogenase family enzyme